MKTNLPIKHLAKSILLAVLIAAVPGFASNALAYRSHQTKVETQSVRHPDKRVHRRAPVRYQTVWVGKHKYLYRQGRFYRTTRWGMVSTRAPRHAIVTWLPDGHRRVVVRHKTYYTFGGTYFSRVASGYKVVAPPSSWHHREHARHSWVYVHR